MKFDLFIRHMQVEMLNSQGIAESGTWERSLCHECIAYTCSRLTGVQTVLKALRLGSSIKGESVDREGERSKD